MRVFHIQGDQLNELAAMPDAMPTLGFLWIGMARDELGQQLQLVQNALQRWTGGQLVDLHVSDLLNKQLPSNFDYTSGYDLLVFRRLAASVDRHKTSLAAGVADELVTSQIDTNPVGFAVFDRVLLTVHPADCQVLEFFVHRLEQQRQQQQASGMDARNGTRVPPSPADLALRMVNHMVDSYLELRRLLTRQLGEQEQELFKPNPRFNNWQRLLDSRNGLQMLEDTCEDQRAAITEWIDALDELPPAEGVAVMRERELLRVRSRDVLEHIERVLTHVRRLESSAETAVQMHFAAQGNRTNDIMRSLTVLTAIFLPLNLVTGFFGMNFEGLPLIHSAKGFWWTFGFMMLLGMGLSWFFWRRRYIGRDADRS